jgi:hypothetical protein
MIMGEKRKPTFIFMLKYQSKRTHKLELYPAQQFKQGKVFRRKYRLKVNGKWFKINAEQYSFFTKWEIRDMIWRGISI